MDEALFQKSFLHKKTGYPDEEYPAYVVYSLLLQSACELSEFTVVSSLSCQ